jgi:hypothetical protein
MLDWINAHGLLSLVIYYTIASAIGALPTPGALSSGFYQWFYKFSNGMLQVAAANATRLPMVRNLLGMSSAPSNGKGDK